VRFTVGITDAVPKFIAYRLLEPALTIPEQIRMICREDKPENLLGELSIHNLDLVITDAPIGPTMKVKAFNHLLGECGVSIYGTQKLMNSAKKNFPKSLHGLPFLMPSEASALRRQLEQWFDSQNIRVRVAGEFDDTALMSAFGQAGAGAFCAPTVIEKEIQDQYGLKVIGRLPQVRERYYAISVERKLKHPAVIAISESAKQQLFTETGMRESARAASNE
jgi:LysR family transcriptional activator of nhaA